MIRIIAAAAGFVIAALASAKLGIHTTVQNRAVEWPENEKSKSFTDPEIQWTIMHIRDDLGAVHTLIVIMNGLLGAILAALIF